MDPIMFATEEKNQQFQICLQSVLSDPYIIGVRNENGSVRRVSLFNKTAGNPGISITTPLQDFTYEELCFLFLKQIGLGLMVVRIIKCKNASDIMAHMKFDFTDKDGRREIIISPIYMYEDPMQFEELMFQPIDITMGALTYINFNLPEGAEIEIMLFQKNPDYRVPVMVELVRNKDFGS